MWLSCVKYEINKFCSDLCKHFRPLLGLISPMLPRCHKGYFCCDIFWPKNPRSLSRLMVVSHEAKKGQSDRQKQNARRTTVCLLHERMFSSFDVIIIVDISRAASNFKPTLKTQNLLANINHHPKDQSNRLSSSWLKSMNFVFTFFFLWRK